MYRTYFYFVNAQRSLWVMKTHIQSVCLFFSFVCLCRRKNEIGRKQFFFSTEISHSTINLCMFAHALLRIFHKFLYFRWCLLICNANDTEACMQNTSIVLFVNFWLSAHCPSYVMCTGFRVWYKTIVHINKSQRTEQSADIVWPTEHTHCERAELFFCCVCVCVCVSHWIFVG